MFVRWKNDWKVNFNIRIVDFRNLNPASLTVEFRIELYFHGVVKDPLRTQRVNEEMRVWKLFGFHKKLLPPQLWITFSSGPLEDISQCIFQALFLTTVLLWKIEFICSGIKCSPSWSSDKGNFCPLNILIRCFYTS